jgi:hypothetical protein
MNKLLKQFFCNHDWKITPYAFWYVGTCNKCGKQVPMMESNGVLEKKIRKTELLENKKS